MEERRRNIGLDEFAQVLREASKARSEILHGVSRLRRAMHAKLDELRSRENEAVRLADILAARKKRRKPPEAGLAVPAVPPKGPLPLQGGAKAPLDFED